MAESGSILGNAVVRLEDPTLLRGTGKYLDDLVAPGAAHVVFVRSTVAHGTLQSTDVEAAKGMPGVLAVYHAGGDDLGLAPFQSFPLLPETFNRPVFAQDRVGSSVTSWLRSSPRPGPKRSTRPRP
jgi:carbon-monoxide dehydrogenase large subunit